MSPEQDVAMRPVRWAAELVPVVLLLALALWDVRVVLQPLVVFPLLFYLLWPARVTPLGLRALVVVCVIFAIWFVSSLGAVLTPFLLALGIAYLLAPVVAWLEKRGMRRIFAIPTVMVPFIGFIIGLIVLLVPQIERQLIDLVGRLPELARRIAEWAVALRDRLASGGGAGILTDEQVARLQSIQASDLVGMVSSKWQQIANHAWDAVLGLGRGITTGLGILLTIIGYFIVAPVVTIYLLADWPKLLEHSEGLIPPAYRAGVIGFLKEYDAMLGRFVRGQLTEATLVAVLTTGGLAILGFPGALLMGVVAALGNLIPNVGFFLSIIPGILIALVSPDIGSAMLKLIAVFAVVQIIDGQITGPRIVGGSVGLSPVWSMMAVLVFGSLLGFVGLFLAVPLAALVKMVVMRILKQYQASPIYAAATALPGGEAPGV